MGSQYLYANAETITTTTNFNFGVQNSRQGAKIFYICFILNIYHYPCGKYYYLSGRYLVFLPKVT